MVALPETLQFYESKQRSRYYCATNT